MKYKLLYHPQCLKRLKKIHVADQTRILEKLQELSSDPHAKNLDIKKMANTQKSYRIRIGTLRAIYEIDEKKKIVYVWEIDYRGNIY